MWQDTHKPAEGNETRRVEFSTVPRVVSELKGLATVFAVITVVAAILTWSTGGRFTATGSALHHFMAAAAICFVIPTLVIALFTLASAGRGVADAEGLRFKPLFRRERALRWASVERLRWSQIAELRGGGGERVVIPWHMLDRERRASLQDLLRGALADRYDLSDVGRPLSPPVSPTNRPRAILSSWLRVLGLTAACLVPAAIGYRLALRGWRHGALLMLLSLLLPFMIAFRKARRLSRSPNNPSRWRTSRPAEVFP